MPSGPVRPRLEDVAARAECPLPRPRWCCGKPGPGSRTREAVLEAARAIGYRPDRTASLLARRRTQLLGVTMDVSSPFHAELLEEVHVAADARGYDVVVSPLTRAHGESRAIETLLDFRCEALLLLGPALPEAALASLAAQHAVVAIGPAGRVRRRRRPGGGRPRRGPGRRAPRRPRPPRHRLRGRPARPDRRTPAAGLPAGGPPAPRRRRGAGRGGGGTEEDGARAAAALGPEPHGGRRVQRPMRARGPRPAPPRRDPRARAGVGRRLRRQPPRPPRHRRPHHSEPVPRPWPRPPWPRLSSGSKAPGARPSTSSSRRTWSSAARPPHHRPPDPRRPHPASSRGSGYRRAQ